MPSSNLRARTLRLIPLLLLSCAALSACVQAPAVFLAAGRCSELLPEDWTKTGVVSAELPANDTVGEWTAFGDAQTGKLDVANQRTKDAMSIVRKCEERYQAASDAMKPEPWWKIW